MTAMSTDLAQCDDGNYSIRHTDRPPERAGQRILRAAPEQLALDPVSTSTAGATQQTWNQIWERQRVTWVAWQLYARALGNQQHADTSTPTR